MGNEQFNEEPNGRPLVIEEIFPLSADVGTTAEFIRRSRTAADGWISFYWGKTPEEYDKKPGIKAALMDAYGLSLRKQLDYGHESKHKRSCGGLAAAAVLNDLSQKDALDGSTWQG